MLESSFFRYTAAFLLQKQISVYKKKKTSALRDTMKAKRLGCMIDYIFFPRVDHARQSEVSRL